MISYRINVWVFLLLISICSLFLGAKAHAQLLPLPKDVKIVEPDDNVPAKAKAFSGVWAGGAWDGVAPHALIVENISTAGEASIIYCWDFSYIRDSKAGFTRAQGKIKDGRLSFNLNSSKILVEYVIGSDGILNGTYTRETNFGDRAAKVFLEKTTLEKFNALSPVAKVELKEETLYIPVTVKGFFGGSKVIKLEATLYRPNQTDRFPVVVFNHGSTGRGLTTPVDQTVKYPIVAHYFVEKGFAYLIPMRRGRGKSGGQYEEGGSGYECGNEARGIKSGVEDMDAVFMFLKEQSWADTDKILIGGASRGGMLSAVYAGRRPNSVKGVINLSGGWMADNCHPDSNVRFFAEAGENAIVPMLWLYAENDRLMSDSSINKYWSAFEEAGGKGTFHLFKGIGGDGHYLTFRPLFWRPLMDEYLQQLGFGKEKGT